jgi:hypothetical protein
MAREDAGDVARARTEEKDGVHPRWVVESGRGLSARGCALLRRRHDARRRGRRGDLCPPSRDPREMDEKVHLSWPDRIRSHHRSAGAARRDTANCRPHGARGPDRSRIGCHTFSEKIVTKISARFGASSPVRLLYKLSSWLPRPAAEVSSSLPDRRTISLYIVSFPAERAIDPPLVSVLRRVPGGTSGISFEGRGSSATQRSPRIASRPPRGLLARAFAPTLAVAL